jgi:hypothetical protein
MRNRGEGGAMKKKVSAKKISEKTRKQAMEKKIKKALTTPQKSPAKTKKGKAAKPGVKTKKPSLKKSTVAAAKKPPAKKNTVAAVKKPSSKKSAVAAAKKPKPVTGKKPEKTGKAVKKVTAKIAIKTEKVRKKTAGKKEEKPPVKTKKKIAAKKPAEKPAKKIRVAARKVTPVKAKSKKVAEKPAAKKVSPEKTKKVSAKKPAEKPRRTVAARVKPEKKERLGKEAQKIRAEAPGPAAEKIKRQKKITPLPEPKTEAKKEPAAVKKETAFPPEKIALYPPVPWETLPSEYGENAITLMTVNPFRLFVFWEVRENTLKMFKGDLMIRTYDVTGLDINAEEAKSFFDVGLTDRIGSLYLDVNPDRQYIADIGILYEGIFVSIARSNSVETPRATQAAEEVLPAPGDETGMRVGY